MAKARPFERYLTLVLVALAFAGFLAWGLLHLERRGHALREQVRSASWTLVQAQVGHLELMRALDRRVLEGGPESREQLLQRFESLQSRLPALLQGEAAAPIRQIEGARQGVLRAIAALESAGPRIRGLEMGDGAGLEALRARLEPLGPILEELVYEVHARKTIGQELRQLERINSATGLAVVGVIVCFAGLAVLLLRHIRAVEQLSATLAQEKARAEEANRVKARFLAGMSHELRTPLNAILGFSQMILTQMMGPVGSPKYLEYAEGIRRSGSLLLELVSNLLDLSRIEAGALKLTPRPLSLAKLVRDTLDIVRPLAAEKSLAFEFDLDEAPERIEADPGALRQVLLNLIGNAIKFSPDGSAITILARAEGESVSCAVADQGRGIAAEDLERVLLPLESSSSAYVAAERSGVGLGLSISKSLVEGHGGRLTLESEAGRGTRVTFTLPVTPAPVTPAPVTPALGPAPAPPA